MTPLKTYWPKIYPPLVEHLKLQVRMNVKSRTVELRNSKYELYLINSFERAFIDFLQINQRSLSTAERSRLRQSLCIIFRRGRRYRFATIGRFIYQLFRNQGR
jgi:hypothetical protein